MSGSIGPTKIPLVATLDPKGFEEAKAQMRALASASQGAGGTGGAAGSPAGRGLGIGEGLRNAASQFGGPLGGLARLGASPGAAIVGGAAVGIELMRLSREIGNEEARRSAQSGLAAKDFSRMSLAAQKAGLSVGELQESIGQFRDTALGAAQGDVRSSSLFRSLGIDARAGTAQQINQAQAGLRRLSGNARTRAAVAIYGDRGAEMADALDRKGGGLSNVQAETLKDFGNVMTGVGTKIEGKFAGFLNWLNPISKEEAERRAKQTADQKLTFDRQQEAKGLFDSSLSPEQIYQKLLAKTADLAANQAFLPNAGLDANRRVAAGINVGGRQARFGAVGQYMTAGDRQEEQLAIIRDAEAAGKLTPGQAERARIGARSEGAAARAPVRSIRENLDAQLALGLTNVGLPGHGGIEKQEILRGMGMQVQDAANALTRSGPLAGAYDTNSVAGYSQQVSMEFDQQKSADAKALGDSLMKDLPRAIADAIRGTFGFQFRPRGPVN